DFDLGLPGVAPPRLGHLPLLGRSADHLRLVAMGSGTGWLGPDAPAGLPLGGRGVAAMAGADRSSHLIANACVGVAGADRGAGGCAWPGFIAGSGKRLGAAGTGACARRQSWRMDSLRPVAA